MQKGASVGLNVGLAVGTKSNQKLIKCSLVRELWLYSRTFKQLWNTGAEEQIYRKQYENFGLVHSRVAVHVVLPGEDIQ